MSKADKTKLLKANIEYYLVMSGYSKEQLATKLGISLASYYNKVKDINIEKKNQVISSKNTVSSINFFTF